MSNTAEEHVKRILAQKIKKYTENDTERNLSQAYNLDKQFSDDYHGRELFELLQNVDDAYEEYCQEHEEARGKKVKTLIEYKNNILRICNTGTAFRKDTIERLCQGAVSGKGEKYIGNKGIGFRSVLNWAKVIRIYSGEYSIEFSKKFAEIQFNKIKGNDIVKPQINEQPELCFPILSAPKWINPKKNDYDTVIEIELLESATDKNDKWNLLQQIEEFDSNILLFLPNVTEIIFSLEDKQYSFIKQKVSDKNVISIESTRDNSKKEYYTFVSEDISIPINRNEKPILKMAIAIPVEKEEIDAHLFTYFPIANFDSPFNALLHATFRLTENRDSIRKESVNETVFKELLNFYVNTVTEFFAKPEFKNRCLELLCPKDFNPDYPQYYSFDSPFDNKEIATYYFDLCKEKTVYLNVNNKYIKKSDNPRIIEDVFPTFFKGTTFKNLLKPIEKSEDFARFLLEEPYFEPGDLCDLINILSKKLTVSQRIETFIWWIKHYNDDEILPKLLIDNSKQQNFIESGDTCFFSGAITKIPSWATIKFLNKEYEKEIINYCSKNENIEIFKKNDDDNNEKRLTIRFLKEKTSVDFKEYTVANILNPLNDAVGQNYNKSVDYINFLYENFSAIKKAETIKVSSFNFPTSDKSVSASTNLYYGVEYGNSFPERILELAGYKKICEPEIINSHKTDIKELIEFLSWFGVNEYPRIQDDCILDDDEDYVSYLHKYHNIATIYEIKGKTIINLKETLLELNEKDIIEWLKRDKTLRNEILNQFDYYFFRGRFQINQRITDLNGRVTTYLNYAFSSSKWIEINRKKYAPSECLISDDQLLSKFTPCISNNWIEKKRGKFSYDEFYELLKKLGVKTKITDFDSESFYSLLLNLQEDDRTYKISQDIYRKITKLKKYNANDNFLSLGKVWTKDNRGYQPISEVFFTSSPVINIENKYLIDIPYGIDCVHIVKDVFGVYPYEEELNIDYQSLKVSKFNNEFQKILLEFLPYVYCYFKDESDDSENDIFRKLKITLVNQIALVNQQKEMFVSCSYKFLRDPKNEYAWYIYINDKEINKYDKNLLSKIIQQIFEKLFELDNSDESARYGELFAVDQERRNFLIEQDFLNLDILEESRKFFNEEKSDKELVREYLKKQKQLTKAVEESLNNLSFSNFSTNEEQKELFDFLKIAKLDVKDLRKLLNRSDISVKEYNLLRSENLFTKNRSKIKSQLFEQLKTKNIEDRKSFLQKISEYEQFPQDKIARIKDSIFYNPEELYKEAVFSLLDNNKNINTTTDVEKFYKANLGKLRKNHEKDAYDLIDVFISSPEIKSLLYFDYDDIETQFSEWNEQRLKTIEKQSSPINYSNSFSVDSLKPCGTTKTKSKTIQNHYNSKPKTIHDKISSETRNQEQGDRAEELVYNALKENNSELSEKLGIKLNDYNIEWCSEAASRKKNINGRDGLGYDIELNSKKDGESFYIEIKSSQGAACEFEISNNEWEFSQKHPDNYIVIFVGNIINSKSSFQVLPKRFWEDTKSFKIVPEKYRIRFDPI